MEVVEVEEEEVQEAEAAAVASTEEEVAVSVVAEQCKAPLLAQDSLPEAEAHQELMEVSQFNLRSVVEVALTWAQLAVRQETPHGGNFSSIPIQHGCYPALASRLFIRFRFRLAPQGFL